MSERKRLCLVTGLSGAGKSTALRAFEDLGFFVVDGLPASLSPDMSDMMGRQAMTRFAGLAIGMDMRESDFPNELNKALLQLPSSGMDVSLVFLEASDDSLLKRYAATRRPHPLEKHGHGLAESIGVEREQMRPIRELADYVIDSSGYSIHDLRRAIHKLFKSGGKSEPSLRVTVLSFGFKYGLPGDADFVFDLRFLENPYFVDNLRDLSGLDEKVAGYVFRTGAADKFLEKALALLKFVFAQMEAEGRSRVTVAMGCTGGRHRSVAIAHSLALSLRQAGFDAREEHRNINDDAKGAQAGA